MTPIKGTDGMDDFTSKLNDQDASLLNHLTGGDAPERVIMVLEQWERESGLTPFEQSRLTAARNLLVSRQSN